MGSVLGDRSSGDSCLLPSLLSIVLETSLRHASTVHPSTRPSTHKPTHRPPIPRPPTGSRLPPAVHPRVSGVSSTAHGEGRHRVPGHFFRCVLTAAGTLGPGSLVSENFRIRPRRPPRDPGCQCGRSKFPLPEYPCPEVQSGQRPDSSVPKSGPRWLRTPQAPSLSCGETPRGRTPPEPAAARRPQSPEDGAVRNPPVAAGASEPPRTGLCGDAGAPSTVASPLPVSKGTVSLRLPDVPGPPEPVWRVCGLVEAGPG